MPHGPPPVQPQRATTVAWGTTGYGRSSGHIPAYSGYKLGPSATTDEVEAFYRRELPARGWSSHTGADFVDLVDAEQTTLWRKGNLGFQLTILKKDVEDRKGRAKQYTTYYEIIITEILQR